MRALVFVLLLAGCSDKHRPIPTTTTTTTKHVAAIDPTAPLAIEALASPVRSARTWTTALAPNPRGGWNFITQTYELESGVPGEFVVLDLGTGAYSIVEGTPGVFAAQKFQIPNQLRAPNGRIFFPEIDVRLAYYDPVEETVKELGPVLEPRGSNKAFYQGVFGPDGMLYLGTQSNGLPSIIQVNPDTLATRRIGEVGQNRNTYSYAYHIAVDPPWIYVAVGESPWELSALNITTGESHTLATRADHGWMEVEARPEGIRAKLITGLRTPNQTSDLVWCVDGQIVPDGTKFKTRRATPIANPIAAAPELDLSQVNPDGDGTGRVRWKPPGSSTWTETTFQVQYTTSVDLESLTALSDGTILGNAKQYHGFFRFDPKTNKATFFGQHGPSRPVTATLGDKVYFTGYPNGALYEYTPAKPWTAVGMDDKHDPKVNPRWLGAFKDSGTKYASFLVPWNDRLYFVGRREREGVGSAIGSYDPSSDRFAGHHKKLNFLDPQGFVVVPAAQRAVLSGMLRPDPDHPNESPAQAELVVFDRDLSEVDRLVVKPGIANTGELFALDGSTIVIGLVRDQHAAYRYDLATKKLLDWVVLDGSSPIGAATQRSDGSIWFPENGALVRLDPQTLQTIRMTGAFPNAADHLEWQGNELYYVVGSELRRVVHVGAK